MARKFLTALDLAKNELQNAVVQNLASAPSTPIKGQLYFDSTGNILYWYNGSGWIAAQGGAGAVPATTVTTQAVGDAPVVGVATTYAREDHKHGREAFGTIALETAAFGSAGTDGVAATVARSDHKHGNPVHIAASHSTFPLSTFAPPNVDVSMGGFKLTNVADPVAATDAANKQYVDNGIAGLSWKEAVRAATTANITLSGLQTVDGVVLAALDRVLVKDQSTAANNGIYLAQTIGWSRAADFDQAGEAEGAAAFVMEGTVNADTSWVCTTNAPISIGVTGLTWAQFSGGGTVTAGAGMTQTGNTLNVIAADASITVAADSISRAALTGEVFAAAGSNALSISSNVVNTGHIVALAVTNAKLANMNQYQMKGRATAGAGAPEDLNASTVATVLAGYVARIASAGPLAAVTASVITHNLNTRDVMVNVYRTATPWDTVECDIERTTVNTVTIRFAVAPAASEYSAVVYG